MRIPLYISNIPLRHTTATRSYVYIITLFSKYTSQMLPHSSSTTKQEDTTMYCLLFLINHSVSINYSYSLSIILITLKSIKKLYISYLFTLIFLFTISMTKVDSALLSPIKYIVNPVNIKITIAERIKFKNGVEN